jgi:hypothetical protein
MVQGEQLLETLRQLSELAVDKMEAAIEIRSPCVLAGQSANEPRVLRHHVFQTPAKFTNLDQQICP